MKVKDLSLQDPAPMDATMSGLPWLPRMADKALAAQAGSLGPYYRYPCPIDRVALRYLGIDADHFAALCDSAVTSNDLLGALLEVADVEALRAFDPLQLHAELHSHAELNRGS